jgi:predicted RNA-binding Zn-ribbon protein involved in translation (DUF1610 family)
MADNQIYCNSCGTANAAGARFCFKCGSPIQAVEITPPGPARPQSDFITLTCPNCGGKLEITPDMERFACKFCGNEHIVRRTGSAVSLAPVVEGLKRVEGKFDQVLTGSDRLAAEQTIQRLKAEITDLTQTIAGKEVALKTLGPHTGGLVASIIFSVIGSFITLCMILQLLIYNREWWVWVVGWISFSFAVGGIIGLPTSVFTPRKKAAYEYAKAELAQLQANLQSRRQQLAQLHRYTAER